MTVSAQGLTREPNYYVTGHFRFTDFICPCCDMVKLVPGFFRHAALLERLACGLAFPITVTSGYRCEKHNRSIGGAPRSWHLLFATDIIPSDEYRGDMEAALSDMYDLAKELGFGGIGRYERHIHLDCRPERALWRG